VSVSFIGVLTSLFFPSILIGFLCERGNIFNLNDYIHRDLVITCYRLGGSYAYLFGSIAAVDHFKERKEYKQNIDSLRKLIMIKRTDFD
jgi:hypothetical protein